MRTLRRIILTAAVGSATFVLTNLTDQPMPWAITLSVLIGGVTLLAQFLVDFEARQYAVEMRMSALERSNAAVASTIREEISRFHETAGMLDRLADSAVRSDAVLKLVKLSADMPEQVPALARDVAQTQVDTAVSFLEQLSHGGEVSYDGEDRDWLLTMTAHARHNISATARVTGSPGGHESIDGGLWNSDLGSRYLDAQVAAIGRGVSIRRIFIVENAGVAGQAAFHTLCEQHSRAGSRYECLTPRRCPRRWWRSFQTSSFSMRRSATR